MTLLIIVVAAAPWVVSVVLVAVMYAWFAIESHREKKRAALEQPEFAFEQVKQQIIEEVNQEETLDAMVVVFNDAPGPEELRKTLNGSQISWREQNV